MSWGYTIKDESNPPLKIGFKLEMDVAVQALRVYEKVYCLHTDAQASSNDLNKERGMWVFLLWWWLGV